MKDPILVIFDIAEPLGLDHDYTEDIQGKNWKTEAHVVHAIRALNLPCELLGVHDNVRLIGEKIRQCEPGLIFNLVEEFKNDPGLESQVPSYLESLEVPFTGCGSSGIAVCKDKAASKKVLSVEGIRVPEFLVIPPRARRLRKPRPPFPLIVKPLCQEASHGIAQASLVETEDELNQRAAFVHEKFSQPAIAEEYIEGRELYVSILGNQDLQVLPIRELVFERVPADEPKFASYAAKWDENYRLRRGIQSRFPEDLDRALVEHIEATSKTIYRLLHITGYARLDFRLTPANELVFIEANPNPHLASDEDFAESARKADLEYEALIERIIRLGRDRAA